ncbi:MAG: hypothetical protein H6705_12305 [Myxococcales bacterium]|nr:hypothetical protein [Myxococcales bacterium]
MSTQGARAAVEAGAQPEDAAGGGALGAVEAGLDLGQRPLGVGGAGVGARVAERAAQPGDRRAGGVADAVGDRVAAGFDDHPPAERRRRPPRCHHRVVFERVGVGRLALEHRGVPARDEDERDLHRRDEDERCDDGIRPEGS